MSSKISVFGHTGFIGSHFLNKYPEKTIGIGRNENKSKTKKLLFLISTTSNYNVFDDIFLDVETNLIKLLKVLEENKDVEDLEFNFISSWFVYGNQESLPTKEDSYCDPMGFYSITKRTAEQLLISFCKTHNINYRILRLCNVMGTGDSKASSKKNAVQFMIGNLKRNETIRLYDEGSHIRDFLHVDDVCDAINMVLEKSNLNEIYNISSGEGTSIASIIDYCIGKIDSKSKVEMIDTPEFHKIVQTKNMILCNDKIKKLGFLPKYSIWNIIDELLEKE